MNNSDFGKLKFNLQTIKRGLDKPDSIEGSTLKAFSNNLMEETQHLIDELFAEVRNSRTAE